VTVQAFEPSANTFESIESSYVPPQYTRISIRTNTNIDAGKSAHSAFQHLRLKLTLSRTRFGGGLHLQEVLDEIGTCIVELRLTKYWWLVGRFVSQTRCSGLGSRVCFCVLKHLLGLT